MPALSRSTCLPKLFAVLLALMTLSEFAIAAEFPYDQELLLDVAPMRGSKRVPSFEVDAKGNGAIELWCSTVPAQFIVAGDTLTIMTKPSTNTNMECDPDRMRADNDLLDALHAVTGWRMEDTVLTLTGAEDLRFRLSTH